GRRGARSRRASPRREALTERAAPRRGRGRIVRASADGSKKNGQERRLAPSCPWSCRNEPGRLVHDLVVGRRPLLARLPLFVEDRPERLIQVFAVLLERLPEQTLLHRANLPQRAVA